MRPIVIGVTGGIGSGKSTAVDAFVRRGAVAFSADEAVHSLYASDEVRDEVVARWGEGVLDAAGTVDRSAIADVVFADATELAWLEALLHPLVAREWLRFLAAQGDSDTPPEFIVAEVPLLFEAGLGDRYDRTLLVTAPLQLRLQRVGERASGSSHAQARASQQMSEQQKAALADFTCTNDADTAALQECIDAVIAQLRTEAAHR